MKTVQHLVWKAYFVAEFEATKCFKQEWRKAGQIFENKKLKAQHIEGKYAVLERPIFYVSHLLSRNIES